MVHFTIKADGKNKQEMRTGEMEIVYLLFSGGAGQGCGAGLTSRVKAMEFVLFPIVSLKKEYTGSA